MAPEDPDRGTMRETSPEQRVRPHEGRPFLLGTLHPATDELRELAGTLGLRLVAEVHQPRDRPHPGTFFGKGRLESLREAIGDLRAGQTPKGWTWSDGEYQIGGSGASGIAPEADEESAWGGTPWVRGAREGKVGRTSDSGEGRRDPLSSPGRGPGAEGRPDGASSRPSSGAHAAREARAGNAAGGGASAHASPDHDAGPPDLTGERDDLLLVLNEDVRPAVLFNLEERLKVEVWDRTRLILEIFGQHAHVKEAKLQVELAMLQYEIPLIHEAVHRRRTGERPGFMGGGEYEVADYEDFIKRRMRGVKEELERIRRERGVRRKVRRERFYLVSLAGYTNAGKSSLLNALTGASVHQKREMFSTLETTTRRMAETGDLARQRAARTDDNATVGSKGKRTIVSNDEDEGGEDAESAGHHAHIEVEPDEDRDPESLNTYTRPMLLTDTVGFIQALPSWLLDAFRSTLEEISVSDVVLLVADVADPIEVLLEKVRVCREELAFLDVTCPVLLVLNKSDLVPREVVDAKAWRLMKESLAREDLTISVSSRSLENVEALTQEIHALLPPLVRYRAEVPTDGGGQRLLSLLYQWGEVFSVDYGPKTLVEGAADPLHWKRLVRDALDCGADVSRRS